MLVQKLRADDLQSEEGVFDGTMVYAQNKVTFLKTIQAICYRHYGDLDSCCLSGCRQREMLLQLSDAKSLVFLRGSRWC